MRLSYQTIQTCNQHDGGRSGSSFRKNTFCLKVAPCRLLPIDGSPGAAGAVFLRDGAETFVGVLGVVAGGLLKDHEASVQ